MDYTALFEKVLPIALATGGLVEVVKQVIYRAWPSQKDAHWLSILMVLLPMAIGLGLSYVVKIDVICGIIAGSFSSQAYDLVKPALRAMAAKKPTPPVDRPD